MTEVIYKYPLRWLNGCDKATEQTLLIPQGAKILSCGIQSHHSDQIGTLCVWATVNTTRDMAIVPFWLFFTGEPLPSNFDGTFLGTTQDNSGLVWHIFYKQ